MTLPRLTLPKYKIVIPSTQEEHFFRPFIVKQLKTLRIAQSTQDDQKGDTAERVEKIKESMAKTMVDVMSECFENLDVSKLPAFDVIYILSQIRAKSVGETVRILARCKHCGPEKKKAVTLVTTNLTALKVTRNDEHTNKIPLTDNGIGIIMRYPTMVEATTHDTNDVLGFTAFIDKIYTPDEVIDAATADKSELQQFAETLTISQLEKIRQFFNTMPKVSETIRFTCSVCSKDNEYVLEGIENFFTLSSAMKA